MYHYVYYVYILDSTNMSLDVCLKVQSIFDMYTDNEHMSHETF